MPLSITIGGSIGFDDLTTPAGARRRVPGGSATYSGLSAVKLAPVHLAGAVGEDGDQLLRLLLDHGLRTESVARLPGPSYRWTAEHPAEGLGPSSERQQFGVYQRWVPDLSRAARDGAVLFLGSMHPSLQLALLEQCEAPAFVAMDTMGDLIASDPSGIGALLARADLLFANERELAALLGEPVGPRGEELAARVLERFAVGAVVAKLGERGCSLCDRQRVTHLAAHPATVVDPTGGGDSLAGGMLGELARLGRFDREAVCQGLEVGLGQAALAISDFGPEALL